MRKFLAVLAALLTFSCEGDNPAAPTASVLPSPTPTAFPTPAPIDKCVQKGSRVAFYNGAGNEDFYAIFDYREPVDARVQALDEDGAVISPPCRTPLTATWNRVGPCNQQGSLTTPRAIFKCNDIGKLHVLVTYGGYTDSAVADLIR